MPESDVHLMGDLVLDPNRALDSSYIQSFQEVDASSAARYLHLNGSEYSVQALCSSDYGYLDQQVINDDISSPLRSLDDLSISHFLSTASYSMLAELLGVCEQGQTEPVNLNVTDCSGDPVPPTEAPVSGIASQSQCVAYVKHKGTRSKAAARKYYESVKGKAARARYLASEKYKVSRKKYFASSHYKAKRERYLASSGYRENYALYLASDHYKKIKAAYRSSEKGQRVQLICNAKSNAYRKALRKGMSEKMARQEGQLAADKKKAELLSVSPPSTTQSQS